MDMDTTIEHKKFQLCELDEFRLFFYENARIYKEKTKQCHDKHIQQKNLILGQQGLLYNLGLKFFQKI